MDHLKAELQREPGRSLSVVTATAVVMTATAVVKTATAVVSATAADG